MRAADALLRALGPSGVILVLPVPTQQDNADLGLATPVVEQVALAPAVVRDLGSDTASRTQLEVLLAASTVNAYAESRNFDPPDTMFDAALGILHGGKLLRIEAVAWDSFAGTRYLYRVTLTD
ncbi:MAG: hypothetical protein WA188_07200 [Terriglobales bacterium]